MALPEEAHEEALRLVADEARAVLPGCEAAGVTVVHGEDPLLVVGTSLLGRQLEDLQWDAGHGPGIDAIRQLQVFNVACLASARSWPEFTRVALSRGVRSSLTVPLTARGRALGALTLYSFEKDAFTGHEHVGIRYAVEAAAVLAGAEWTTGAARARPAPPNGPGRDRAVS